MTGGYHWALKLIHWTVAILVIGLVPVGLIIEGYRQEMVDQVNATLGPGGFNLIYDLHKSAGLTVLGLMILRVVVRAVHGAPEHVPPLKPWERVASRLVHWLLYGLLIVTPIVGWLGVSTFPAPAPFRFLFDAKLPVEANRAVSDFLLKNVHGPLAITIAILALVHMAAAFKHWLVNRDRVMQRMTGDG